MFAGYKHSTLFCQGEINEEAK